ncbi:MAG: carboxypeptidase regulatory-like domain-containing protein [Chloroflexi bacterium]|nr:carboxypeptidase regulatory-like domain-containing protein [Chloroflexota bacterium]
MRLVVVALLSAALMGCAPDAPVASPSPSPLASGIRGLVLVGPECPRPSEASPCLAAYVARIVILDIDGQRVGEVTSDADGTFEVLLPPGEYILQPVPGGDPWPRAEARSVTVIEGELSDVEIDYERGR